MTPRPIAVLLLATACAAQVPSPSAPSAASHSPNVPVPVPAPTPNVPVPVPVPAPTPNVPTPALTLDIVQLLNSPLTSIALGEGSHIAVLADPPQVGDARGLHSLPLTNSLRAKPGEVDEARIFFGRDNEPRIMGSRHSSTGESAIYWRHLPNGWRDGREEIGQLGGTTHGGLWGVLGGADPELVCRAGGSCIIKRNTGWTTAPAGPTARVVTLQDGVLWGLDETGIAGIDAHGWSLAIAAPTWSAPRAFWATQGEAWVSTERALFHFQGGAWTTLASPLSEVTAFWGARADSVWFVGKRAASRTSTDTAFVPPRFQALSAQFKGALTAKCG